MLLDYLGQEHAENLRAEVTEHAFPAGSVIVSRDAPDQSVYVIQSGQAEVQYFGDEGEIIPSVRLGPKAFYGRTGILREHFESSELVAVTNVIVHVYPENVCNKAMLESESFRSQLFSQLSRCVRYLKSQTRYLLRRSQALNRFLSSDRKVGPLVASSRRMRAIERNIPLLARNARPLLISGEPGTGKFFLAKKVCEAAGDHQVPFMSIDCANTGSDIHSTLFGSISFESDLPDGADGAIHLTLGGYLVLRHIDALDMQTQEHLFAFLNYQESTPLPQERKVRIIATTQKDLGALSEAGNYYQPLAALMMRNELRMPALIERRSDILPLARHFLSERRGESLRDRLTPEAEAVLFSHRYRHKNVSELRDMISMADFLSDGTSIRPKHLSTGPSYQNGLTEYDVTRFGWVRWLLKPQTLAAMRSVVLATFVLILGFSFLTPASSAGRTANSLIWSFWEPVLVFSFLFFGRLWCTICPLATVAGFFQRHLSLGRPVPPWMKKYGIFFGSLGLVAIIASEHLFHMTKAPFHSGILLLVLFAGAILFAVIYHRQVWCRFLCPLGLWGGAFAPMSILQLRANPSVCSTRCTTQECSKGDGKRPGCPTLHHPLYSSDCHNCKMCFDCLSLCPHDSPKVYARPPLEALWGLSGLKGILVPFVLSLFFFSLIMLASWHLGWLTNPAGVGASVMATMIASFGFSRLLPDMLASEVERDPSIILRIASAYLVLAWGPLLAYQIENVPILPGLVIHAAQGVSWSGHFPSAGVSFIAVIQILVILLSASLSALCFLKIHARLEQAGAFLTRSSWRLLGILFFGYLIAALAIVMLRDFSA